MIEILLQGFYVISLSDYQLYLFDFDGLLVNTEELHFLAYKKMMADRGIKLEWDLKRYCQSAHYDSLKLREDISNEYPALMAQGVMWDILYKEKQKAIKELLHQGAVEVMPGVERFLSELQSKKIPHTVVTHSPHEVVQIVRNLHPIIDAIPFWITRHDYTHAKPHPESYELAIQRYSKPGDKVIGFEDTPRGLQALLATSAKPVLVTQVPYPEIPYFISKGVEVFPSFKELMA